MTRHRYKRVFCWDNKLAYVVGLLTSDGCLSNDGRHIDFTSKDLQLVELYRDLTKAHIKVGLKRGGNGREYFRVQFGDVAFYDFLVSIGLSVRKSKTIRSIDVPNELFADFLRGLFDGDGSIHGAWDTRWKNSYMYYTAFYSASYEFLVWLKNILGTCVPGVTGHLQYQKIIEHRFFGTQKAIPAYCTHSCIIITICPVCIGREVGSLKFLLAIRMLLSTGRVVKLVNTYA